MDGENSSPNYHRFEKKGILLTGNYNKAKYDRTLWYSIDYDRLEEIATYKDMRPNSQMEESKQTNENDLVRANGNATEDKPIPETNSKTNTYPVYENSSNSILLKTEDGSENVSDYGSNATYSDKVVRGRIVETLAHDEIGDAFEVRGKLYYWIAPQSEGGKQKLTRLTEVELYEMAIELGGANPDSIINKYKKELWPMVESGALLEQYPHYRKSNTYTILRSWMQKEIDRGNVLTASSLDMSVDAFFSGDNPKDKARRQVLIRTMSQQ